MSVTTRIESRKLTMRAVRALAFLQIRETVTVKQREIPAEDAAEAKFLVTF
jgi:hypothetical protein